MFLCQLRIKRIDFCHIFVGDGPDNDDKQEQNTVNDLSEHILFLNDYGVSVVRLEAPIYFPVYQKTVENQIFTASQSP
jgi:hypothetical protein